MSIELHCPHCEKLIRAPENAGGKHGKCPYCQQSVYIPMPMSDADAIPLAPLDEADARREEELLKESIQYASAIDRDNDQSDNPVSRGGSSSPAAREKADTSPVFVDVPVEVERFVRAMHGSKLDEAEKIVSRLKRSGSRARDYVDGLYLDQMPPQMSGIPGPLIKGFLKALLERLG